MDGPQTVISVKVSHNLYGKLMAPQFSRAIVTGFRSKIHSAVLFVPCILSLLLSTHGIFIKRGVIIKLFNPVFVRIQYRA